MARVVGDVREKCFVAQGSVPADPHLSATPPAVPDGGGRLGRTQRPCKPGLRSSQEEKLRALQTFSFLCWAPDSADSLPPASPPPSALPSIRRLPDST